MSRLLQLLFFVLFCASYSLASNQWVQRADFGNFGRHRGVSVAIGNKGYAGTGHLNGTGTDTWYPDWWEYDPATNAWAQKADFPGNNGNGDQDIVALGFDTVCYAGLGQIDGTRFFKYNPTTNQWTQVASPPANGDFNNTFPFRIGQYGYFPGLYSSNFFRYDPQNDQWIQLNPLPQSTVYGIPTFAIGDYGYIKYGSTFYQYTPATDSWTPKAAFPGLYPHRPVMIDQYGYGYVIGGFMGSPTSLPWEWNNEVWRYDPSNDSWFRMDDFEGATRRWAVACNVNGRVFYGLGTNGTNFNDWWEFSPMANVNEMNLEVHVYPNPASHVLNIKTTEISSRTIHLINMEGQIVKQQSIIDNSSEIDVSDIDEGLYFLSVSSEINSATTKIIIQH